MYFDTHAHYDRKQFDEIREDLLTDMYGKGISKIINVPIEFESNKTMRDTLKCHWIYYAAGIHPNKIREEAYVGEDEQREKEIRSMAKDPRTVAIGETGLDYHSGGFQERQKKWFRTHIRIALDEGLPLILHAREAEQDVLDILKEYEGKLCGVIHCFRGDYRLAFEYIENGFYIGVGGALTYVENHKLRDAVMRLPLEKILLETDAPYVRPSGWQHRRNNSLSLSYVAEEIARLKNITKEQVVRQTFANASQMFPKAY